MNAQTGPSVSGLPETVEQLLTDLVEAARQCFRDDLRSIVLFGSAAEGRLRPTSDLNLLLVLTRFEKDRVDLFREPLRVAHVAGRAAAMFVLESELAAAADAFAVKFDDIGRRRRVLYGEDVIAGLATAREARKERLCQALLNLSLRLRERYAATSLREERLVIVIAEAAGPLRSAAATLLELEGQGVGSPKEALERISRSLDGSHWAQTLEQISTARESRRLPAGAAAATVFRLMALAEAMRLRAERLA